MTDRQVAWLADKAKDLVREYDAVTPTARLRTFSDVEELWRKVVGPALPTFLSMQIDPRKTGRSVPEQSRWAANWKAAADYRL
jgi:hypothetical protein